MIPLSRKTIIASALAVSLLTGGVVIPSTGANAAAATISFTDVSKGHWAEKHITKLALQGIITGYNGLFRPGDSVTRQEAVLMALRFAGVDDEVRSNDVIVFPASFEVSGFYKAYIALAFEKNLLDREDEYALAESESGKAWGTEPASREWVTKLLVRAIGEDDTAESLMSTSSSFGDASTIGSDYIGYVNAAVSLELVKGVSATKFDPKSAVNRASLATLFSRAERLYPVDYAGQQFGIVSKLDDSSISVYDESGEKDYELTPDTVYYRYDSEQPVTLQDLQPYTDVAVIGKDGEALYVEAQSDEQHINSYEATLDRVIPSEHLMYVWIDNKPVEVVYDDSLIVKDGSGKDVALDKLARDSVVTITEDSFRPSPVALSVTVKTNAQSSVEGTFYGTDDELITIMQNGVPVSKVLDDDVSVEIDGVEDAEIDDLVRDQDKVKLSLDENGKVTKIEVVNRDVQAVAGAKITSYDFSNDLLTLVDSKGTTPYALFITDKTNIQYDGSEISLSTANSMLKEDRTVSFTYSGSNIVNLELLSGYTGTLSAIDKSKGKLTLSLSGGTKVDVPYTTPSVEIANVASPSMSDVKVGDIVTVKLTATQDKASVIRVHKTIQYDVVNVIEASNRIQIKNDETEAFRLDLDDVELKDEDGDELELSSYGTGDVVNVAYTGTKAVSMSVVPVTYGAVKSVASGGITMTANGGKTVTIPFDDEEGHVYVNGEEVSSLKSVTGSMYAAAHNDENGNIAIYATSGEKRTFTEYDSAAGQILTLKTSDKDSENYYIVLPDTKYTEKSGGSIKPETLKYGDEITVYSFRNVAIAVIKS